MALSDLKVMAWFGTYSIYNLMKKEINNIQGTSIKGITKEDLLGKKILIPHEKSEQNKIGSFFGNIDNTITLHQRQLEIFIETKKAFIQKMLI